MKLGFPKMTFKIWWFLVGEGCGSLDTDTCVSISRTCEYVRGHVTFCMSTCTYIHSMHKYDYVCTHLVDRRRDRWTDKYVVRYGAVETWNIGNWNSTLHSWSPNDLFFSWLGPWGSRCAQTIQMPFRGRMVKVLQTHISYYIIHIILVLMSL